jgi:glycosyltransferase involved in cell wall biosynthesis
MPSIIAFVTYEAPWFRCGGLAAVMDRLPTAVRSASSVPTIVITPFHVSTDAGNHIASLPSEQVGRVSVPYQSGSLPVTVFRLDAEGVVWCFLKVEGAAPGSEPAFFAGRRHPFDLPHATLVRDALVFGAGVVRALPVIAHNLEAESPDWQLVLQDWEAATSALAFVSHGDLRGRLFLALHNSYDTYAPPADQLMPGGSLWPGLHRVGIQTEHCPGQTMLERAFSVVERPVFTVSDRFASELTEDLLQRDIMVPHLQATLRRMPMPILGVDNGPFTDLVIPHDCLKQAASGDISGLAAWKAREKAKARDTLGKPPPDPVLRWGDVPAAGNDGPWLIMAGRDDPRQKGYDVAAAAVEGYLARRYGTPGCARFLFFPVPGDEGVAGLGFLKALAERFNTCVLVCLGRWDEGFGAALRGSVFGLVPSLYEPFGMAGELYLAGGCVAIARATGGNVQQVIPLRASAACSRAVEVRADAYHSRSAHPTGLLFRERDDIASAARDWAAINDARYDSKGGTPTRVEARRQYALFEAMVKELRIGIEEGLRLYSEQPDLYFSMVAAGVAHIQRTFSWNRAAQEYLRYLL